MQVSPVSLVNANNVIEQKKEYDGLIEVIETVQNVLTDENLDYVKLKKQGIAFYVAAIQELKPLEWKKDIADLKCKIISLNDSEDAAHEVCWELEQEIYQKFFAIIMLKPQGTAPQVQRTWKLFEMTFKYTAHLYKTTQGPFSFGGVPENYLPDWIKG